ncbi:MAG: SWIM zinc finger family protein [Candidatus Protochlamydia sp.]|nr:SWIM zinc finger family protein [Candidatus Protochlamydia sp.]
MKKIYPLSKKITPSITPAFTSHADELEFREKRGQNEEMSVKPLKKHFFPFVTYSVKGQMGVYYSVEIRSLTEKINSCSCPDFQINTLGTCKHIEGVFHHLNQNNSSTIKNSPFVEIYLAHGRDQICIAWPKNIRLNLQFKAQIESFFSIDNFMIADPLRGMASIHHTLFMAPLNWQKKIRISAHLKSWIFHLREKEGTQLSKDQFLKDVSSGTRDLQLLNTSLNPYQQEGMLHLAFNGRAILADEIDLGNTMQAIAACEFLRRNQNIRKVLIISTATKKSVWKREINNLTKLSALLVVGNKKERLKAYKMESFFFIVHYEQIRSDFSEIQLLMSPDAIIIEEVQKIKNWQSKTAWAVKQLKTPYAFILCENFSGKKIEEIYSIMQIVDSSILGPLFKFNQKYYTYDTNGRPVGYKNLEKLHQKIKPFFLCRKGSEN